jgi:hypothetical protein
MGDMNKIVTEHVRVSDLPEHVRRGMPEGDLVKVTVESTAESADEPAGLPRRTWRSFLGSAPGRYANPDDIAKEISDLRDEWDHR